MRRFAAGAETSPGNLFVYIDLECVRKGNVHRTIVGRRAATALSVGPLQGSE